MKIKTSVNFYFNTVSELLGVGRVKNTLRQNILISF